jgi:alpha-L-fucosidase
MTHKGNNLYLHIQDMPSFNDLVLPTLPYTIIDCQLLDGSQVAFEQNEQGISIRVPEDKWEPLDTIIRIAVEKLADND